MRIWLGIASGALGLLAACASLTQAECRAGNWYEIGLEDGANGRLPSYIEAHAKSCADLGIRPDPKPWEQGRQAGLKQYCTPQTAYSVGRSGRSLSPVCPDANVAALQRANARGREYDRLTARIVDLEDEIRDITSELRSLDDTQGAYAASLRSERQWKRLRILGLESERRRVASL